MKCKPTYFVLVAALSFGTLCAQERQVLNRAFDPGEELTYVLRYGFITAGEAVLRVKQAEKNPVTGRSQILVEGVGKTKGSFNWFFKVEDYYGSLMDEKGLYPTKFKRRISEGGYKKSQDYVFYHDKQKVKTQDDTTYSIPAYIQDMFSAFYFARTLNFDTAKIGDVYSFKSFVDNKIEPVRIRFLGKTFIDTRTGKYRVLKFSPAVIEGNIFDSDDALSVYISDDPNRIPILAEAKVLVGSIKMELKDYRHVKHPLAKVP